MQHLNASLLAALTAAGFLAACGGSGNDDGAPAAAPTASITSLGADGWASLGANNLGTTGTTGGHGADAAHTFTVRNRAELIQAMYPDAVIAADGSFTSAAGADKTPKILRISGTIDLNVDASNTPITEAQYLTRGNCLSTLQAAGYPNITDPATFWTAYKAAYAPNVWNTGTLAVGGKPPALSGALEAARRCASTNQTKIVSIELASNTSLIGVGATAKITHGALMMSAGTDNVVIRNITFEDSFDYWPAWDPTDSFPSVTATPDVSTGCSTTTPTKCIGGRWNSNYDLISAQGGTHLWVDHCSFSDGANNDHLYPPVPGWNFGGNAQLPEQKIQHHDGLVDVTKLSHYVTLSYNHMHDHDKTNLLGGGDTASTTAENPLVLGVTFHHNYWQNTKQRQPRVRFGKVHVYNNYYTGQLANLDGSGPDYPWLVAWTAGTASKLYIENNVVEVQASPLGDKTPKATDLAGASSSASNYNKCTTAAGKTWGNADCGTYFYDNGNLFNGVAVDIYAGVNLAANAQPISNERTAATKYWQPSALYPYTLEDAAGVKAKVMANAGAGKL